LPPLFPDMVPFFPSSFFPTLLLFLRNCLYCAPQVYPLQAAIFFDALYPLHRCIGCFRLDVTPHPFLPLLSSTPCAAHCALPTSGLFPFDGCDTPSLKNFVQLPSRSHLHWLSIAGTHFLLCTSAIKDPHHVFLLRGPTPPNFMRNLL